MRSIRDMNGGSDSGARRTLKEEVGDVAARYAGKSEEELMSALRRSVAAAKENGTFSTEQIESFVAFVAPSLDEQSRARLKSLVEMIEEQ